MIQVLVKRTIMLLLVCTPLAFIWMACWVTVYPLAKRRSRQQLPQKINHLDQTSSAHPDDSYAEAFTLRYGGYAFHIEPDKATVSVEFNRWKTVEINDQKPYHEPRTGMSEIDSKSDLFDGIFRTRRVIPQDRDRIHKGEELVTQLEMFYMRWLWRIRVFRINDNGMQCCLNSGYPFASYIPADMLEPLIHEMCDLATLIEETLLDKSE